MSRRFPPEVHAWMATYIPGHTCKEVSVALMEEMGVSMTPSQVKSYKANHGAPSGTRCGVAKGLETDLYPQAVRDYIEANHTGVSPTDMIRILQEQFGATYTYGQLRSFYKRYGYCSGIDTTFKPGHVPPNPKGTHVAVVHPKCQATQFKKGNLPPNTLPIGTVLKKDGYFWKKVSDTKPRWKQLHRLLWEEAYGPIPKGHVLIFLDGNTDNVTLENLKLVSMSVHQYANRKHLRFSQPEITATGLNVAELQCLVRRRKRKKVKEKMK